MSKEKEQLQKLIEFLREAMDRDKALREKYEIGEKFRFVKDRLTKMLTSLEEKIPDHSAEAFNKKRKLAEDEVSVYVYLYNAQGIQFRSWVSMLNAKLYYEYSVNRPIYTEKKFIESLLRSKTNKTQHAFLTIAVKKSNIIKTDLQDALGNPVIKVREGSLHFDRTLCFTHNEQDYIYNAEGELTKA